MKKQIFICGNFGYKNNQLDGQTIKTRELKDRIEDYLSIDVVYTDTSYIRSQPIKTLFKIVKNFIFSSHTIIMPDKMAYTVLLPFYILFNIRKTRDIRYVVIGGWLPGFLKSNPFYRTLSRNINCIYVEAEEMKAKINSLGLNNVKTMYNFRQYDFLAPYKKEIGNPIRVVFFSRVLKEKGVEMAISAVNRLYKYNYSIKLDIIGPINSDYKTTFENIMSNQGDNIKYLGYLEPNVIHEALSNYDFMLFPTYFSSEGFPGAVIDAYVAGLPIIASDWKYNTEFVKHGKTGYIFKNMDLDDMVRKIQLLIDNPSKINEFRKNCKLEAGKYHVDSVLPSLLADMNLIVK